MIPNPDLPGEKIFQDQTTSRTACCANRTQLQPVFPNTPQRGLIWFNSAASRSKEHPLILTLFDPAESGERERKYSVTFLYEKYFIPFNNTIFIN